MDYQANRTIWEERVAAFRSTKMEQKLWCEENDLSVSTLRYWLRKVRSEESCEKKPDWLSVNLSGAEMEEKTIGVAARLATVKIGPFAVDVSDHFDPIGLARLLKALIPLC